MYIFITMFSEKWCVSFLSRAVHQHRMHYYPPDDHRKPGAWSILHDHLVVFTTRSNGTREATRLPSLNFLWRKLSPRFQMRCRRGFPLQNDSSSHFLMHASLHWRWFHLPAKPFTGTREILRGNRWKISFCFKSLPLFPYKFEFTMYQALSGGNEGLTRSISATILFDATETASPLEMRAAWKLVLICITCINWTFH